MFLVQFGYAHMHCGSHGVYPEVCGWVCSVLLQQNSQHDPALDLVFVNASIGQMRWSGNDNKEAMSIIGEDMIHSPNKLGTMGTRKILRTRNAQQSIIYVSVMAAVFNFYCDFVIPQLEELDATVSTHVNIRIYRACRKLLSMVSI